MSCLVVEGVSLTGEFGGNLAIETLDIVFALRARFEFEGVVANRDAEIIKLSRGCLSTLD